MVNPGDMIEVITKDKIYKGCYLPNSDKITTRIKLDSGYNLGILNKKIKEIKVSKKKQTKQPQLKPIKKNKSLKKITILHTGGTVASKVDYTTGGVSAKFKPEEIVTLFPELKEIANIDSRLVSNMFSGDINFNHINKIAKEIEKEIKKGTDGIIITHGTDTMPYTAAALTFILENLKTPVILVGAQRSSDRGSSDAALNLICASQFITKTKFNEVAICMHSTTSDNACVILPSLKTKKFHSSKRNAFKAVNTTPIATITGNKIKFFEKYQEKSPKTNLNLMLLNPKLKIGILRSHPNMWVEEFKAYSKFDGLILEGTGLGHFPVDKIDNFTKENETILKAIKTLAKKMPVIMTTSCIYGSINMNVYSYGRKLQEVGVLGDHTDMLTETAFIKLAWLLSNRKKEVYNLMKENLFGEISRKINNENNS